MPLDPDKIDRAAAKVGITTRAALAAHLGKAPSNLSRLLSGKHDISLAEAERIATALKTPLPKLLA